jgi:KDO2-lipid IV(A) lauroyltransferase
MTAIQKLQYFIILAIFRLFTLLPLGALYLFSRGFTFLIYTVFGYRKKVVFDNLQNAFTEKPESEIEQIAAKYYSHLSALIIENLYLRFAKHKSVERRISIENPEIFEELKGQGKNLILMLGHTGNWEYPAALFQSLPYTGAAVYKQLSNPAFDKVYYEIRKRTGVEPVEMKEVLRKLIEWTKKQTPFALCMVADQAPMESDTNHWITFLNQDTDVYSGSEKLAKKFDLAVLYIEVERLRKGYYKLIPHVITTHPKETKEFEITERYFQLLEKSIIKNPPYWLWSHRRWKHKRMLPNKGQE